MTIQRTTDIHLRTEDALDLQVRRKKLQNFDILQIKVSDAAGRLEEINLFVDKGDYPNFPTYHSRGVVDN